MLHSDYVKLPSFPIPSQVSDARERIETSLGSVTVYRFDDRHIALWWNPYGALHDRMRKIIETQGLWNTTAKAWQVSDENAEFVLEQIQTL